MGEGWVVKCGGYLTTKRELEVQLGEVELLLGGTQQKGPHTNTAKTRLEQSGFLMQPCGSGVWLLLTAVCHSKKDDLFTHKKPI